MPPFGSGSRESLAWIHFGERLPRILGRIFTARDPCCPPASLESRKSPWQSGACANFSGEPGRHLMESGSGPASGRTISLASDSTRPRARERRRPNFLWPAESRRGRAGQGLARTELEGPPPEGRKRAPPAGPALRKALQRIQRRRAVRMLIARARSRSGCARPQDDLSKSPFGTTPAR